MIVSGTSIHDKSGDAQSLENTVATPSEFTGRIPISQILTVRRLSSRALLGYLVTNKEGFCPSRARARSMGWGTDRFYAALWDLADAGCIERPSLISDPAERARAHRKDEHVAKASLRLTFARPEHHYVIVRRSLIQRLGLNAFAVLLYVAARGCRIYPREVAAHFGIVQRGAFQILDSLARAGHLVKEEMRDGGKFAGHKFRTLTVNASPGAKKPDTALPDTASPDTAFQDTHIKEESSAELGSSSKSESTADAVKCARLHAMTDENNPQDDDEYRGPLSQIDLAGRPLSKGADPILVWIAQVIDCTPQRKFGRLDPRLVRKQIANFGIWPAYCACNKLMPK